MESNKKIEVAVIGGGIAGLCLAIGLLKHQSLNVTIFEAASKFSAIGAGIAIGPNGQRALELINKDLYNAFKTQATNNLWDIHRSTWFQYRVATKGLPEDLIAAPTNETGQVTVHRALFLEQLVKLVPKEICHFGKRVDQITDAGDDGNGVTIHFKDGSTAKADCVIGADGIHSSIRRFVLGPDHPATKPQFTHTVGYRALVPIERARQVIQPEYAENSLLWVSKNGGIMTYPIDFGKTMNIAAVRTGVEKWENDELNYPASAEDLDQAFSNGFSETAAGIISLMKEFHVSCWCMQDMLEPAPYYNKGNVCVMGDAAHASTPYQAQGAAQAIEDALVLTELFGHITDVKQIAAAFKAFDHVRRPRGHRVIATSRELCDLVTSQDFSSPESIEKVGKNIETRMHWMWNNNLVEQNQEALDLMKKFLK